jgi:hypothetical protein
MPEITTVWAVDLVREPTKDRQGTLSLEPGELVFEPRNDSAPIRIPLASIRKIRRVHGSPVLLVVHAGTPKDAQTAFYFVQPPPLEPVVGQGERPTPFSFGRASKRRRRRENVQYLGMSNASRREQIDEWVDEVRWAMRQESG